MDSEVLKSSNPDNVWRRVREYRTRKQFQRTAALRRQRPVSFGGQPQMARQCSGGTFAATNGNELPATGALI